MNRTAVLLILVAALGAGAYFMFMNKEEGPATSVVGADREFSVDKELVYKIFLADRNGNKTTLTRQSDHWVYNDEYIARPDAIESLLRAVDKIRMRFKPTEAAVPHMINSLATNGIKVEIYGKANDLLKAYYIGGATNDELGTYAIIEGAEQPYVTELPNWKGNIRFRYNLTGDDWRDRSLFKSKLEDIAQISVEYPKQQGKSFRLDLRDGEKLSPFYPLSPAINAPIRPGRIEAYTTSFESVQASRFNNYDRNRDSIIQQLPFAIISLNERGGDVYSLKLFPIYGKPFVEPKTGIVIQPDEVTAYMGLTQDDDFMMVQNGVVSKILWAYDFFYEE